MALRLQFLYATPPVDEVEYGEVGDQYRIAVRFTDGRVEEAFGKSVLDAWRNLRDRVPEVSMAVLV